MQIPVIRGIIDRRILVNFRVDPEVLTKILAKTISPKTGERQGDGRGLPD